LILGIGETLSLADVSWLSDLLHPLPQQNPSESARPSDEAEAVEGSLRRRWNTSQEKNPEEVQPGELGLVTPNNGQAFSLGGMPLEQIERRAILDTLRQTAGNQTKAARVLGISDRTLRVKIRRYREQGCLQATR
jgi:DNA-binding NtrC family response regulator